MIFLFIIISPSSYSVVDHRTLSCAGTAGALARGAPRVRNRNQPHPPSWIVLPCVPGRMVEMKCPDFYKLIISHTAGKCKPVCIFLSARPARLPSVPPGTFAIRPARRFAIRPALLPSAPPARVCRPPGAFATPPGAFAIRPARTFAARPALLPSVPPGARLSPAQPRPALFPSVPPGARLSPAQPRPACFAAQPRAALLPPIPPCCPSLPARFAAQPHPALFPSVPPGALICTKKTPEQSVLCSGVVEATPGIEPGNEDFADPCLTAWLCRRGWSGRRGSNPPPQPWQGCALPNELLPQIRRHGGGIGTPSGARTLDTLIKSQVLYQLS